MNQTKTNKLSVSFTLGKLANIDHIKRVFVASNVDPKRICDNIQYVDQDVEDAYHELFDTAVQEYNAKQKQPCRRISNYYKKISESKREEAFYEVIVQFGDNKTAPCQSENGKLAKKMLDDYIKSFRQRNPNLHVFNAALHMDEASPHLHIVFIPFYTKGRTNGLSKGVSMKSALIEQGFVPEGINKNQLVMWEDSERNFMEQILNNYGFTREDRNATYKHKTVEQYKQYKDEQKIVKAIRQIKNISDDSLRADSMDKLKEKLKTLESENKKLHSQNKSPYKSFYYSSPEKQDYVQSRLDELEISYRENENGFEVQECFTEQIRKIEKDFKPQSENIREKICENIDRLIMQSKNFDEFIKLLEKYYEVKQGKYIAVRPQGRKNFIRLKSLGEFYTELALRNRITNKNNFETDIKNKLNQTEKNSFAFVTLRTIEFYTVSIASLPMKKKNSKKPFSWKNDKELDRLLELNQKINSGATAESLKRDFEKSELSVNKTEQQIEKAKSELQSFYDLKEMIEMIFENKPSQRFSVEQARKTVSQYSNINASNYKNIEKLISSEQKNLKQAEKQLAYQREELKSSAEIYSLTQSVLGGTFVQSLVKEERIKRQTELFDSVKKS